MEAFSCSSIRAACGCLCLRCAPHTPVCQQCEEGAPARGAPRAPAAGVAGGQSLGCSRAGLLQCEIQNCARVSEHFKLTRPEKEREKCALRHTGGRILIPDPEKN